MILLPVNTYQIKKTKAKGRGVFARREIAAGTVVGDYTGLIIKDAEIERREKKYGNSCYTMDYSDNGLSIFPLDVKAAGIHLVNHSCTPNCDTYFYFGHTLFFALRRILPGEELTIDYGFDPEDKDKQYLHPCACGSSLCRGTMYTSDDKLRRYGAFCRKETKNQKFPWLKAGEVLGRLDKYPTAIKDNAIFNLFADMQAASMTYNDSKLPPLKELRRRLRDTGRMMNFKNIGLKVIAVADGKIIAEK